MIQTTMLALSITILTTSNCVQSHEMKSNDYKSEENLNIQYAPLPYNNMEAQLESKVPEIYAVNIDTDNSIVPTHKTYEDSVVNKNEVSYVFGEKLDIFQPINGVPSNSETHKHHSDVHKITRNYPRDLNHFVILRQAKLTSTKNAIEKIKTSTIPPTGYFTNGVIKSSKTQNSMKEFNTRPASSIQKTLPSDDRHPLMLNIAHNHLSNVAREPRGSNYKVSSFRRVRGKTNKLENHAQFFIPELAVYRVLPRSNNS